MESFLFSLSAVFPIVSLVALGYFLKKKGMITPVFGKSANQLVFRLFLPVMLFLNIHKIQSFENLDFRYILYTIAFVLSVFAVFLFLLPRIIKKEEFCGVLLQASFRSNFSHVGIPLTLSLVGEGGVAAAALLSALLVPVFNILAVISLSVFRKDGEKISVKGIAKKIATNPIILGVAAGLVSLILREFLRNRGVFFDLLSVDAIAKPLKDLGNVASPLALLALGAEFEFSHMGEMKKEILIGTAVRVFFVPTLALGTAFLLGIFEAVHFATFIAAFATPVAIASVPMAQEMGADSRLAGQLVVWTTIVSGFTIFLYTFVLKVIGIF